MAGPQCRVVIAFAVLATVLIATRACHVGVLWADDNLPLAADMLLIAPRLAAARRSLESEAVRTDARRAPGSLPVVYSRID